MNEENNQQTEEGSKPKRQSVKTLSPHSSESRLLFHKEVISYEIPKA